MKTSNCRSCNAPIVWTRSVGGKAMPLDAKPAKGLVIDTTFGGDMPGARVVDVYTSHFSTCPQAAQHRKPKGGT